jgi:sigma-B regulation protein RsbU (phosphoserine phosphatase)
MAADTILILGFESETSPNSAILEGAPPKSDKTELLLTKLGYKVVRVADGATLPDFVAQNTIDGILLESSYSDALPDLIEFVRGYESTRSVPIVAVIDKPRQLQELKEKHFNRLELLQKPVSIGILASRIATNLRVRKIEGADRTHASLGDMNARLRDINDRLSLEREEAKRIQLALLPEHIPKSEIFDLAVSYRPLEDVGGDWYYFRVDKSGSLSIQVADITGHGISAAFIGSMTKLALTASGTTRPGDLLGSMNRLMAPVLPEGRFVTMASIELNPIEKTLVAGYAGHPPALLWRAAQKKVEELKCSGFPLGFDEEASYVEKTTNVEAGDILITYTDGLSEALNRSNQMFGIANISEVLQACSETETADEIMKRLFHAFDVFREERLLKDDVTVLVLKIK